MLLDMWDCRLYEVPINEVNYSGIYMVALKSSSDSGMTDMWVSDIRGWTVLDN